MFTNAIQTIDWTAIGQQIVDFFSAIDWVGLGSQLFTAGVSLISGLLDVFGELPDYSGQLAHALKRVQRMGSAV